MTDARKQKIQDFHLPAYNEIPDVGLFLEQTAKFVNSYLEPLVSFNLTTSMISNYVKKKLITNPVKKQYSREQIAHIIFIAVAKTVLSLEDIQRMFRLRPDIADARTAYEYFCQEFEHILRSVFNPEEAVFPIAADEPDGKVLLHNTIIAVAHKIYLDESFQELREME